MPSIAVVAERRRDCWEFPESIEDRLGDLRCGVAAWMAMIELPLRSPESTLTVPPVSVCRGGGLVPKIWEAPLR